MKQCVSCVGSVFEFASATICALIVSQLELECTESEGSRKSGSELGRYCGNRGPGCSLRKVLLTCALLSSMDSGWLGSFDKCFSFIKWTVVSFVRVFLLVGLGCVYIGNEHSRGLRLLRRVS